MRIDYVEGLWILYGGMFDMIGKFSLPFAIPGAAR